MKGNEKRGEEDGKATKEMRREEKRRQQRRKEETGRPALIT